MLGAMGPSAIEKFTSRTMATFLLTRLSTKSTMLTSEFRQTSQKSCKSRCLVCAAYCRASKSSCSTKAECRHIKQSLKARRLKISRRKECTRRLRGNTCHNKSSSSLLDKTPMTKTACLKLDITVKFALRLGGRQ